MARRPQASYEEIGNLLARLCEEFPKCFKFRKDVPRPLKVGIRDDLRQHLGAEVSDDVLYSALSAYCNRPLYLQALWAPGAQRIGLDGESCGPVDQTKIMPLPTTAQRKPPATPPAKGTEPKAAAKPKAITRPAPPKSRKPVARTK
jgi:sRNA-binding protein